MALPAELAANYPLIIPETQCADLSGILQRHPQETQVPQTKQQQAYQKNEIDLYRKFLTGENRILPWRYLNHPERGIAGNGAIGPSGAQVIGEKILVWQFSSGYMRVETYAEGHIYGLGRFIEDGWRRNETVWERSVYLYGKEGVVIKNEYDFFHYPDAIKVIINDFAQAQIKKDHEKVNAYRDIARKFGYDLLYTNCGVKVAVPNYAVPYRMHRQ